MFALITGGATGLGKRLAQTVVKRGGNVVIADIDQKAGYDLEHETFDEYGEKRLKFIECDVTNDTDVNRTFEFCKDEFGTLNVLCNNAGIMTSNLNLTHHQVALNLTSLIECTFKGIEAMSVKNGGDGGVVINISSGSGYNVLRGAPVYTATKFGVVGFSRTFKFLQHVHEDGVRVNCLCPLFLDTEMTRKVIEEIPEVEYQLHAVGYSDMDDVARAFMFCVDDERMNGETIAMHGPSSIYQLKFRQPIPVPLKSKLKKYE